MQRIATLMPLVTLATGSALMIVKICADSEPGAIPLFLVGAGIAWLLINRVRARRQGPRLT